MLHHVSFGVSSLPRAKAFYNAVLAPLGYVVVCSGRGYVGFRRRANNDPFYLTERKDAHPPGVGAHLAFTAPHRSGVDAFHAQGLGVGAQCNGKPALRTAYGPHYYAAFLTDLDGYRIEAVCDTPPGFIEFT